MDKVTQPQISKWRRGAARLTLEQMNQIEEALGQPRGWILARAGYIDVDSLAEGRTWDVKQSSPAAGRRRAAAARRAESEVEVDRLLDEEPVSEEPELAPRSRRSRRQDHKG